MGWGLLLVLFGIMIVVAPWWVTVLTILAFVVAIFALSRMNLQAAVAVVWLIAFIAPIIGFIIVGILLANWLISL